MNTKKIIKNIVKNLLLEALSADPGQDQIYNTMKSNAQKALSKELATVTEPEPPPKRDPKKPPADPAELEKAKRAVIAADPDADPEALSQRNKESWDRIDKRYQEMFKNIKTEFNRILDTANVKNNTIDMAHKNKENKERQYRAGFDAWKRFFEI